MKKLIAVLTLFFAFSISVNAQDKKNTPQEAAQKDIAALIQKVTINENLKKDLYTLMVMKHEALAQAKTPKEKEQIAATFGHKVMAGLDKEQRAIVEKDGALLKQLTQ